MRYTFSNYNDNTHTDWLSYDNVGVDAPAYLLTGYLSGGDYQRDKQLVYMTTHFKKTESPTIMSLSGVFDDVTAYIATDQSLQINNSSQPYTVDYSGTLLNGLSLSTVDNTVLLSGQTSLVSFPQNMVVEVGGSDGKSAQSTQIFGSVSSFSFFLQGWFYSGSDTDFKTVQSNQMDIQVGNYVCSSKDGSALYSLNNSPYSYSITCHAHSVYGYTYESYALLIGQLTYFSYLSCSDDGSVVVASINGNVSGLNVFKKDGQSFIPWYQETDSSNFKAGRPACVSPDGNYLLCMTSTSDFKPSMWAISNSGLAQIPGDRPPGGGACYFPTWFKDSRTFIYIDYLSNDTGCSAHLCRLDPNSGVTVLQTIDSVTDIFGNKAISSPLSVSSDGNYLYVSLASSPYVNVYQYDGQSLTLLGGAIGIPDSVVTGLVMSKQTNYALVGSSSTELYTVDGQNFTKATDSYLYGSPKTYTTPFLM